MHQTAWVLHHAHTTVLLNCIIQTKLGQQHVLTSLLLQICQKIRIRKDASGAIQNLQYCTHMKYTMNTSFFLLHQCILTRLQFYYGTRYFNTTNCFIIYSVLYNVRACIVDWYHVYVLCSSQWFYKMNHWVLISDRGGHFCLLVGSPPQPLCADLLTEPPLPANLLSLGTLFWMW